MENGPYQKLVVPEINAHVLTKEDKIIANPNCSTIQMVMVLNPLHLKYKVKRVIVSTYQSVSGTGKAAVDQLNAEIANAVNPGSVEVNAVILTKFSKMLYHSVTFLMQMITLKKNLSSSRNLKKSWVMILLKLQQLR